MRVGGQRHAPAALPPEKTRYPLYRRLGWPQGRSGRVRKISSPPAIDPRPKNNITEGHMETRLQFREGAVFQQKNMGLLAEISGFHIRLKIKAF